MIFRQFFEAESSTYTYLLACPDTGQAVFIDPVVETLDRDLAVLQELGLRLAYTLDTHIHADHISSSCRLRQRTGCKIALPALERLPCADTGVADGEGRNSVWLAMQGMAVTAFDFSPVGLGKARRLAERSGVTVDYRRSDVNDWDWEAAQYDVVVGIFVQFASPPERQRMFAGMRRALKPGGILILQGYRPEQIEYGTGGPKRRENMYDEPLLRESFADLKILHFASHDDLIDEGPGHSGMSALIDMVARQRSAPPR